MAEKILKIQRILPLITAFHAYHYIESYITRYPWILISLRESWDEIGGMELANEQRNREPQEEIHD